MAKKPDYSGRDGARRLEEDRVSAEAASRKAEAKANVLRGRRGREGSQFDSRAAEASQAERQAAERVGKLRDAQPERDFEGTSPPMADRSGNFAADARVAQAGGIGVVDSNTDPQSGQPATDPDKAGQQTAEGGALVFGRGGQPERLGDVDHDNDEHDDGDDEHEGEKPRRGRGRKTAKS